MLANPVLRASLSFPRTILMPIQPIMSFIIYIGLLLPILHPLYQLIMSVIWFPFYCYMNVTSCLYREIWFFRPLMAIITIPVLIVIDVFLLIMPATNDRDKFEKASMIDTWPFKLKSNAPKISNSENDSSTRIFSNDGLKIKECTLCGDLVRTDWTQCPKCKESLDAVLPLPSTRYTKLIQNNNELSLRWGDEQLMEGKPWLRECTLCGDIVRASWRECPRCGEELIQAGRRASVMVC